MFATIFFAGKRLNVIAVFSINRIRFCLMDSSVFKFTKIFVNLAYSSISSNCINSLGLFMQSMKCNDKATIESRLYVNTCTKS